MAGELRATVPGARRAAEIMLRFEGDAIRLRSDRLAGPAVELFKLRAALRRAGLKRLGVPLRVSLGRLPTFAVSL